MRDLFSTLLSLEVITARRALSAAAGSHHVLTDHVSKVFVTAPMIAYFASRCPTVSLDAVFRSRLCIGWIVFLVSCWLGGYAVAQTTAPVNNNTGMWRPYRHSGTAVPNTDRPSTDEKQLPRRMVTDPFADELTAVDPSSDPKPPPMTNPDDVSSLSVQQASYSDSDESQEPAPFQLPPGIEVPTVSTIVFAGSEQGQVSRASFDPVLLEPIEGEYLDFEPVESGGCPHCGGNCGSAGIEYCQATWTLKAEYLLWSMQGFDIPALVTSSSAGTPRDQAGILGQPNTSILFGQQTVTEGTRSGARFSVSRILDPTGLKSIELNYFFLGQTNDSFSASSDGSGILARPFFSVESGAVGPNAELVAFPGILAGNISVNASSEMQGFGVVAYQVISRSNCRQIRLFAGYNYNQLDESLHIQDFKRTLDASLGLAVGTTISEMDQIRTDNQSNSFVLGADLNARHHRWTVDLMMKLGLGNTNTTATLDGRTTTTVPLAGGNDVNTVNTGLLVLDTNRGVYEKDEFSVIPQLGIDLGFQLTRSWSAHVGYDFIYWSRVARPGDQVDTNLNLSQLAAGGIDGITAPVMPWKITDLRIHAVDFGLQFAY